MHARPNDLRPLRLEPRAPAPAALSRATVARPAILLNANAKRVDRRVVAAFERLVGKNDLFLTTSLGAADAAVRRILEVGYRTVLFGGGDGTIAAALERLARIGAEPRYRRRMLPDVGVLRLGTGNALASLSGSGRPLEDATRVISGAPLETTRLRVLESPGRDGLFPFGSLGYDAQVLNDFVDVVDGTRTPFGRRMAKSLAGYLYAVGTRTIPAELRREPTRVRIVSKGRASILDPDDHRGGPLDPTATLFEGVARAVLVGSTPNYGYGIKVLPFADRRADRFQLRVSTASIPYILSRFPKICTGALRTPHFVDFLVEDVRIETSQPLPLQLSGDAKGQVDALRVRLSDRSFRLLRM